MKTRMHPSRMRTSHSLTVCCSLVPRRGGVCLVWGGSAWSRGVSVPGGVCLVQGGFCLVWGVCLVLGDVCS